MLLKAARIPDKNKRSPGDHDTEQFSQAVKQQKIEMSSQGEQEEEKAPNNGRYIVFPWRKEMPDCLHWK